MQSRWIPGVLFFIGLLAAPMPVHAEELEVLHYWTSGGESKAVNVLKQEMEKQGHVWKDSAVAGGGGANAMTVLKTRVIAGNPPGVVQMRGPAVQDWADQGTLVDLDPISKEWTKELPPAISGVLQYKGKYYAAPHWVHRVNWMYINKAALDKAGGAVPTNWNDFFVFADKLKAAGFIPIAHGGTPYHDAVFFEGIVLSQGVDFYRKAIVELDSATLGSPKMVEVFDILRKSQNYFDPGIQGRPWNLAAAMVIEGKAGVLFMGDWAKGEFSNAGKAPGKDYVCAARPGTEGVFTFIADGFVFFKQKGQTVASRGQQAMASTIMSPAYQQQAALYKGAIPARPDVSMANFDDCAKKSATDMQAAIKGNTLMPSMNQAVDEAKLGAIRDVVTKFMNSKQDSKSAAEALARAATS
ncbi:MAG: ABC transporter substrate-binding protein [Betaproteobacteria bacterium]